MEDIILKIILIMSSLPIDELSFSNFSAYIKITDDKNFTEKWSYASDKLDFELVMNQAMFMKQKVQKQQCLNSKWKRRNKNVCNFQKPFKIFSYENFRKKRNIKELNDCTLYNKITNVGIAAEIGKQIVIDCQTCSKNALVRKLWFKFLKENQEMETFWHAVELQLDEHNNLQLNKRYVTPYHDLIINDFQPRDIGVYFCVEFNETLNNKMKYISLRAESSKEFSPITILHAWEKISGSNMILQLVIVDVMFPITTIFVSRMNNSAFIHPRIPIKNTMSNWILYIQWAKWSTCLNCDEKSEKRRDGNCLVSKLNPEKKSNPSFLEKVFSLYPFGAPCQSSIFQAMPRIINTPNEIEVDQCFETCKNPAQNLLDRAFKQGSLGKSIINTGSYVKKSFISTLKSFGIKSLSEGDQVTINKRVGLPLELNCPGAEMHKSVNWLVNGTRWLQTNDFAASTHKRAKISTKGSIVFRQLLISDTGHYNCFVNQHSSVYIVLEVVNPETHISTLFPAIMPFIYCFALSLLLFIILIAVEDMQRFILVRDKTYKQSR